MYFSLCCAGYFVTLPFNKSFFNGTNRTTSRNNCKRNTREERSGHCHRKPKGIDGAICRYFVICQGNSPSQVEAITESVGEMARLELGEKPSMVAGLENAQWVAMDYGDVMVHIFVPDTRVYYDLEHLWDDADLTHIEDID